MTAQQKYLAGLISIVLIIGGVSAYAASRSTPDTPIPVEVSPTPSPLPSPTVAPTAAANRPAAQASQPTGRIEGRRIFPAAGIPADFSTCAINLANGQATCIGGNQLTYQLTLAPGKYQVYAIVPSFNPNYRAYYSQYVVCGLKDECQDHTPLTVTVPAGGVVSGVDAGDFYL